MSEYDAFGRKKDEAGLGDLGWGAGGDPDAAGPQPDPPSATVSAAESGFSTPTEFKTVTSPTKTFSSSRSFGGGKLIANVIRLAVLVAIAFGIYSAVDAGNDAVNSVRDTFGAFDDIRPGSGGDQGDTTVPEQIEARKLFTPAGLRDAVKAMEREVPGRLETFAIRRERINATVIAGGERAVVQFAADAEIPEVFARTSATAGPNTFSYEEINYEAPARLIRASNQRVGRSEADVDYVLVQNFTGELVWGVYYKGGSPITQGDSRGRFLRRID